MGLCQNAMTQENEMDIVQKAMDHAAKYERHITLPETDKAGEAAAREAFDRFQSQEFQEKIASETERIKQTLFGNYSQQNGPGESNENICLDRLADDEKIYLFISSSIPLNTLRTYVSDLDILNDPNIVLVLRGFVGNMEKIRPTLEFIESLLVKDSACRLSDGRQCDVYQANIQIDPLVFRKFNIQQVPALAYVKKVNSIDTQNNTNSSDEPEAVVIYGDVSLDYALDQIFAETGNPQIKKAVQKIRGDFYER
jgi:type-F conjugative transfer system pilin assembly protein TrbC